MRWAELKIDLEEEERRVLPGYKEPAAVRTFDAPEALDTRFYEVRSKSVLNRVPERSAMPFRWTINPYRGCTHACAYCTDGRTAVLMADGRTKPIAEIQRGDLVFGTSLRGRYRRYVKTPVLAHWSSIKPAYRVTLEDGTELVASGDHRFLTEQRGWKHVADTGRCPQRAHLTTNNSLLGTGQFAQQPEDWNDYRLGYLCGIIRGDGTLGTYRYAPTGRGGSTHHRFRLALADTEALRRARTYLADRHILTQQFAYAAATHTHRASTAIRTSSQDGVAAIRELIRWPRSPRPEWCKGFLAGIFDAEGSHGQVIRICNKDEEIIDWIASSLKRLGFAFVIEGPTPNGCRNVRLTGGLQQKLRFFHTVDPAISRKRDIAGIALKSPAKLKVEEIESLGRGHRLYDITTASGDFIANGVVSHNCFARPTHTYLGLDAGRGFEKEIVVKVNAPEVLRRELRRPSWKREHVAMGTNTDPYQWVESRYRLMPGIWEALAESGTPASVLTKSPLLLRDIEGMKRVPEIRANLSVPTLDEKAWRSTEPHTPHPRKRLEAVAELNAAGIPCGVLIAPLMPGINDSPDQVARIIELAEEAGAVDIGGIALHLRGEVKGLFFDWLREHRPDLLPHYERLYARGAYAPKEVRGRLSRMARGSRARPGWPMRGSEGSAVEARDPAEARVRAPPPPGPPAQEPLF